MRISEWSSDVCSSDLTPQRNQRLTVRLRATLILGVNMQRRFNPLEADARWQHIWGERQTFRASDDSEKPRSYVLEMFPYPSGRIHIGNVRHYRSEERRVGKECVSPCGTRWTPY